MNPYAHNDWLYLGPDYPPESPRKMTAGDLGLEGPFWHPRERGILIQRDETGRIIGAIEIL